MKIIVKRIGDDFYITKGIGKLKTSIYPHDIPKNDNRSIFPLNIDKSIGYIITSDGKEVSVGLHTDYIKRYFEL